ncbi:MAG: bifunctional serine/threonine-protein kinase/formylglycine-generating enzyme family protein, partial [Gemmatimonadaceae bacterium]
MPDPLDRLTTALAGRYRIERELGAGGMATVYLAEDIKHHRLVAIKVLRAEFSAAISAERFLHEIRVTASLQHPHILPLFDSGEAEGVLFYVMPYVAEASLRDRIAREGRLPLEDALAIAGDVASALTFAHAHGIIHRDIKPENILLEDGEALVADFGIALARAMADDARLTETGLSLGTPTYMSPEQIMGERTIDGRSDVYALGCVLFEMLTGAPPFTGPTAQAIIGQGLTTRAPSVRSRRPDLSPGLDAVLSRALAKEPAERFATPRDMMEACRIATLPRVRARWVAGVSLAAVALLSIVAFPLWRRAQADRARNLLPAIGQFAQDGDYAQAYDLALRAEKRLAGDSALGALLDEVSDVLSVTTEPAGATVHVQRISAEGDSASVADSVLLGTTPIDDVRVSRGDYRVVVRKAGYATMERIASSAFERVEQGEEGGHVALALQMQLTDSIPPDMVAVPGGRYTIVSPDLPRDHSADLQPFFIDRFEVSNDAYGAF